MLKENTSLMNTRSYCQQAQGDIPDDKTSSPSTADAIKHSMSDDLTLCCQ